MLFNSVLANFSCNIQEYVREGEMINFNTSIDFTHFSPSFKCNMNFSSHPILEYKNMNDFNEILKGKLITNHFGKIDKTMSNKVLKCELYYNETIDALMEEIDHLKNIEFKINVQRDKLDTRQPKLFRTKFECNRTFLVQCKYPK